MGQCVVMGAMLQCSFGLAPASLIPTPSSKVVIEKKPAATIQDVAPSNIPTFGMCQSLANPQVAAATSAAMGVLTPMPCVPAIAGTWIPAAPKTTIGGQPALVSGSTCICSYGGQIQITFTGAVQTTAS